MKNAPEFVVWTGPMWSGKSSALLAAVDRLRLQGRRVEVFKPRIDDRYAAAEVVTHGGWRTAADPVETGQELVSDLMEAPGDLDVVAVDELFMIQGGSRALVELFRMGVTVLVSSLDLSATGTPFPEVQAVLPWATRVEKLTAVCAVCKADARYTWKKGALGPTGPGSVEIEVGGSETYEPRCWRHHPTVSSLGEEAG